MQQNHLCISFNNLYLKLKGKMRQTALIFLQTEPPFNCRPFRIGSEFV